MDIPGGFRRIVPHEFLLGASGRCGAAVERSRHASVMYDFAGIR